MAPVLEELKDVDAPIEMFVEIFPPPVPIHKLLIEIEPVTPKDPVIWADPVKGNPVPLPPGVAFIVTIPVPVGPVDDMFMLVPAAIWVTPPPGAYEADNA